MFQLNIHRDIPSVSQHDAYISLVTLLQSIDSVVFPPLEGLKEIEGGPKDVVPGGKATRPEISDSKMIKRHILTGNSLGKSD